jgi:hypothetical protein
LVETVAIPTISKIVNYKYSDTLKVPPTQLEGKGIFTRTNFLQATRKSTVLKRISDDTSNRSTPTGGAEKLLKYLINADLIHTVDPDRLRALGTKVKVAYRISDDLRLMMENQNGSTN